MPGRRPGNVRSGHRAEALGVYAFTEFCAVAQVPLEEDIGWDAICTILAPDTTDSRKLWAGASFWIQFKTESVASAEYDADGKKWLAALPLPFFYCTVNKEERRFRVYSTYHAWPTLMDLRRKMMVSTPAGTALVLGLGKAEVGASGIALGDPIVEWILGDGSSEKTREVLGAWVELAQKQLVLSAIEVGVKCTWTTNDVPTESQSESSALSSGSELDKMFLERLAPYLGAFGRFLASKKAHDAEVPKFLDVMKAVGMENEHTAVKDFYEVLQKLRTQKHG